MTRERGFSLLEVLVALAVLAIAVLSLTALRTESIVTAAHARNERIARMLAEKVLSELQAGMLKVYDIRGQELDAEDLPRFRYKIIVGEPEIQDEETQLAEWKAEAAGTDSAQGAYERQEWLQKRSIASRARAEGKSVNELGALETEADDEPDEDTFEEVAVYVYYPSVRAEDQREVFRLRSSASTLALSGLTNEQAQERAAKANPGGAAAPAVGGAR